MNDQLFENHKITRKVVLIKTRFPLSETTFFIIFGSIKYPH